MSKRSEDANLVLDKYWISRHMNMTRFVSKICAFVEDTKMFEFTKLIDFGSMCVVS